MFRRCVFTRAPKHVFTNTPRTMLRTPDLTSITLFRSHVFDGDSALARRTIILHNLPTKSPTSVKQKRPTCEARWAMIPCFLNTATGSLLTSRGRTSCPQLYVQFTRCGQTVHGEVFPVAPTRSFQCLREDRAHNVAIESVHVW